MDWTERTFIVTATTMMFVLMGTMALMVVAG
jgi:hypothetical protein